MSSTHDVKWRNARVPLPFKKATKFIKNHMETKSMKKPLDRSKTQSDPVKECYWVLKDPEKDAEDYVLWLIQFASFREQWKLHTLESLKNGAKTLLGGKALKMFQTAERDVQARSEYAALSPKDMMQVIFDEMGKTVFRMDHAYQRQVDYLCYVSDMGGMKVRDFMSRLKDLNSYLPLLPGKKPAKEDQMLSNEQLRIILERARPARWQQHLLTNEYDVYSKELHQVIDYFDSLEQYDDLQRKKGKESADPKPKEKKEEEENIRTLRIKKTTYVYHLQEDQAYGGELLVQGC